MHIVSQLPTFMHCAWMASCLSCVLLCVNLTPAANDSNIRMPQRQWWCWVLHCTAADIVVHFDRVRPSSTDKLNQQWRAMCFIGKSSGCIYFFFCLSPALSLRSGTGILAILVILAMWTERERERENISHFAASGKKAMEAKAKRITYR